MDAEGDHAKREKAEQQKAKRKAQAAARRKTALKPHDAESSKRAKTAEQSPAPTLGTFSRNDPDAALGERYASPVIIPSIGTPGVHDAATPGSERIPSPAPPATSSLDAQIAGLAGYHDTSAYNTDYEDAEPVNHDGSVETDGDVDVAEVDPIEDAVSYSYGVRR